MRLMNDLNTPGTVGSDQEGMELAIRAALAGIEEGQSPFGACVVKDGRVLACAHNAVWQKGDPSAHAEVNAIRQACQNLGTIDLSGCVLYATCEPCPMCYSACHWARISRVVFGAGIEDAVKAGFNEMQVGVEQLKEMSGDRIELVSGFMKQECRRVFQAWIEAGKGKPY